MSLIKNLWRLGFSAIVLGIIATFSVGLSPDVSAVSSILSVDLSNGVAIRVVDKTGATSLSSLDMELNSTPLGAFTSDWFNIEVSTPNKTGYKLYMSTDYTVEDSSSSNTSTYTTALTNITDSSYTIPTLQSSSVSLSDFSTAGGSYVNRWGYSLDNTAYNPVPDHTTTDLIKSTSEAVNKELVPVYIGANVNMDKPSGTYRNQLVFSAVANPIPTDYSLYFEPGTTDTVTNLPDTMTASEIAASHTFTIPSTTPSRTGYVFTGYLDESTSAIYQPGDTITVLGDEEYTGSATLTAQWEFAGCSGGANRICFVSNEPSGTVSGTMEDQTIVYMTSSIADYNVVDSTALSSSTTELTLYSPNWTLTGYGFKGWNTKADGTGTMYGPNETITLTSDQQTQLGTYGLSIYAQWAASDGNMANWSGCSSLTSGSVTALTYGSDTYAIAKLADGKCWMIENLRTSTNAGTNKGASWTTTVTDRQYNLINITGTDGAYPINLTSPAAASSTSNQYSWKSYGGYYSWASAINTTTAGNTQYTNWDGSSYSTSTTAVTTGICPSGWRIPRSYAGSAADNIQSDYRYLNYQLNGSYDHVDTAAASNNWRKYPNNFVFSGLWDQTYSNFRGTIGTYYSSTVYNSSGSSYSFDIRGYMVWPNGNGTKRNGRSVRCVFGD